MILAADIVAQMADHLMADMQDGTLELLDARETEQHEGRVLARFPVSPMKRSASGTIVLGPFDGDALEAGLVQSYRVLDHEGAWVLKGSAGRDNDNELVLTNAELQKGVPIRVAELRVIVPSGGPDAL